MGELPDEDAADAGASPPQTVATDVAAAVAAVVAAAVPGAVVATVAAPAATAADAPVPTPPQPMAGLVPARLDGTGAVAPVLTGAQAAAAAESPSAPTAAPAAAGATTAPATGTAAPVAAPPGATGTAPPATLTMTLTPVAEAAPSAPAAGPPAQPAAGRAVAPPGAAAADAAPAPRAAEPAPAVAPVAPPAPPVPVGPLDGLTRAGAMTTPHELARELGHRVRMAVREGGRELLITLRPPDLGHLTIRVTMTEGVMQAQIVADRPEAARMLQQSLGHLGSALDELGYSLDSLDISYGGQDPRDAHASTRGSDAPVTGEVLEADGTPVAPATSTAAAGSSGRLDLLA